MIMLGLEIGDSLVTAVAVDDDGRVLGRETIDAKAGVGEAVLEALDEAADRASAPTPGAVGVAAINPESPAAVAALAAIAPRYTASNDGIIASGVASAMAEAWVAAARAARDDVFFCVADHVTAGIVRNGAPLFGAHHRATSIAWLALNPVEREDYRKMGCLEAEVAAAGIVRRLIWRIKAGDRSRVADAVGGDFTAITVDLILDAARQGDGVSISVVRDTAKYLGMAAANLVVMADPDTLVLGGIMATADDLLMDPVRTELVRRVPRAIAAALVIVPATLGADAAAIGAARFSAVARQ